MGFIEIDWFGIVANPQTSNHFLKSPVLHQVLLSQIGDQIYGLLHVNAAVLLPI